MTTHFSTPEKSRPLWQVLLAPMLLVSLGLHGLLLLLPAGSENVVIPPPDPEQDSVAITRVPPAGESEAAVPSSGAVPAGAIPRGAAGAPLALQPPVGVTPASQRTAPATTAPANQARTTASRSTARPQLPAAQTSPPATPAATTPPPAATTPQPATTPSSSQPLFEGDLGERLQTYVASLNLSQERIDQLLSAIGQRLAYSDVNTSDADYSQNLSQWQQAVRTETGLTTLTPEEAPTELSITYYQRACLSENPGTAQVGVIVSPVGSPRREPVLLRSSGYGIVDAKALRTVADHQFPRGGEVKAYTVTLPTEVDHGPSDCLTVDTVAQNARASGT